MGPAVFVGPFHLREASVREILSRVAGQEGPAAWVVTVPPKGSAKLLRIAFGKCCPIPNPRRATRRCSSRLWDRWGTLRIVKWDIWILLQQLSAKEFTSQRLVQGAAWALDPASGPARDSPTASN